MNLLNVNLYTVTVRGPHGIIGSFIAAAADTKQAKAIGERWAVTHDLKNTFVEVRRKHIGSEKPIYIAA